MSSVRSEAASRPFLPACPAYASHRPRYPEGFFDYLDTQVPGHNWPGTARRKINPAQAELIDRLELALLEPPPAA